MSESFTKSNCLSAAPSVEAAGGSCRADFPVRDYDLAATLTSGQVFRWQLREGWWEGVIGARWVRLRTEPVSATGALAGGPIRAYEPTEGPPGFGLRQSSGALAPGPRQEKQQRAAALQNAAARSKRPAALTRPDALPKPHVAVLPKPRIGIPTAPLSLRDRGQGGCNAGSGACTNPIPETNSVLTAETAMPVSDWCWLTDYLQLELDLAPVLASFPEDQPMRAAVAACRGLRLLRQAPWECLASFILSSTKQIVQIQQIVARLCEQFGEQVIVPQTHPLAYSFPTAPRISAASESELRACKMGFRAPNLRAAAHMIAGGELDLDRLAALSVSEAREALTRLPGVGRKIADCVLLFAYGFQDAFPVDVWVMKALRGLYFPRRSVSLPRLQRFAGTHFGPWSGYAQQYLFHYARVHAKLKE